jgi:hypothetical protein
MRGGRLSAARSNGANAAVSDVWMNVRRFIEGLLLGKNIPGNRLALKFSCPKCFGHSY